ncbi:MAG: hypothetical protein MNPFHGCM_00706 [Gemmatimonadaceae bacterium]|nr:hypothetical protein [Gemmatimonadaceae bacterium]
MTPGSIDPIENLLDRALERGIIDDALRQSLGSLQHELMDGSASAQPGAGATREGDNALAASSGAADPLTVPARDPAPGLNSVTVAYVVGAMLVVFASFWFLVERWDRLGAWGVLLVAGAYMAVLLRAHVWLDRRGFRHASAIALMLVVPLVTILAWCLENVTGFWPAGTVSEYIGDSSRPMALQWAAADVATLLAAVALFHWRPSVALTVPITIVLWALGFHVSGAIAGTSAAGALDRWLMLADGLLVCTVAGEVDRWQTRRRASTGEGDGDFAFFLWLGGLLALVVGYVPIWTQSGAWRHLLLGVAATLIVVSLRTRRRTHLAFGLLALFGYLAYLAMDVFKAYLSIPVALAILGLLLILATVWVQRRFPILVQRVNAERGSTAIPRILTWGPLLYAMAMARVAL